MKLLAFERELKGKTKGDFDSHLTSEANKVWEYYKKGIIREIYFTKETHEAVLLLECESKKEAENYLTSLPLVQAGLIRFDITKLVPYDGFERLFQE